SLASVNLKFPSCKRMRIAVVSIGSAIGAPAVVVSMSIFLRMVHSLFHQAAWALFAQNNSRMTARNDVDLIRCVLTLSGLKISSPPRRERSRANRVQWFRLG